MNDQSDDQTANLILSQEEVRAIDAAAIRSLGMSGLLLMENAARGVTDELQRLNATGRVTIICGPGNNGGDGLAIARQRAAAGLPSRVILETAGKSLTPDAQANFDYLSRSEVAVEVCDHAEDAADLLSDLTADDWIVESLLGTGVTGGLRPPFAGWVQAINASPAQVLAVDVPTGLNCDDGTCVDDCVQADVTVTFVGIKRGFLQPVARAFTGRIQVAHIGIPDAWVREWVEQRRAT